MNWVSFVALFFVTWWLVLFAVLPFSLRTQDEDGSWAFPRATVCLGWT